MKNKALTYLLVAIVGFVWYKVFFRVKDNLFGEETEIVRPNNVPAQLALFSRDTFSLQADYRDPFGETKMSVSVQESVEPSEPSPIPTPRPKPSISWPEIVYFGQIQKTGSKKPLGIISIDGYKHALHTGETIYDGILIKSIGRDSIAIRYQKEQRIYWRD